MNDETLVGYIDNPVLGDAGAGVKGGFGRKIETDRGVGNLDHQVKILGPGLAGVHIGRYRAL
jgi:hypothetical protein